MAETSKLKAKTVQCARFIGLYLCVRTAEQPDGADNHQEDCGDQKWVRRRAAPARLVGGETSQFGIDRAAWLATASQDQAVVFGKTATKRLFRDPRAWFSREPDVVEDWRSFQYCQMNFK